MIRPLFYISITAFWLLTMNRFIQREFFSASFSQVAQEWAPLTTDAVREDYQAIYLGNQRLGFEYHGLRQADKKEQGAYLLQHNSYINFRLLGEPNEVLIRDRAWLAEDFTLNKFTVQIQAKDFISKIEGAVEGSQLKVTVQQGDHEPVTRALPMPQRVFYSESLTQIWTPSLLRPGKEWTLAIFNPQALATQNFKFRVERREKKKIRDQEEELLLVLFGSEQMETRLWITPDGLVRKKETPNGLTMVTEPGWEIFDAMRKNQGTIPDLPNLFSIPSDRMIQNPRNLDSMEVTVTGPDGEKTLSLKKQNPQKFAEVTFDHLENPPEALRLPETRIPSDDAAFKTQALELRANDSSVLSTALRIMAWVHKTMTPFPSAALSDARDLLKKRKGDCKDYTLLFVTLARAAGIPAQSVAGLVYQDGRFFYHAWAAVYVNEWIYLDPTFNQSAVDATHIPLVIGNFEKQSELAEKIGRLKVRILHTSEEASSST